MGACVGYRLRCVLPTTIVGLDVQGTKCTSSTNVMFTHRSVASFLSLTALRFSMERV
jgi:hypothetical protein